MALTGTAMALVYFGILWLVRNTEFTAFATPVISRVNSARRNS
jgi:putative peptidoglycan lipid II flippase